MTYLIIAASLLGFVLWILWAYFYMPRCRKDKKQSISFSGVELYDYQASTTKLKEFYDCDLSKKVFTEPCASLQVEKRVFPVKNTKQPKPDKDGWIENTGVMPVGESARVDIVFKSGEEHLHGYAAGKFVWELFGLGNQIIKWRPHKAKRKSTKKAVKRKLTNAKRTKK